MANSHDSTEPVAWRIPVSIKHHNGTVTHTHQFRAEKASSLDEPLYAAPPDQQPHDQVAVTWDAARTRILAVTLQDAEGCVLCVIDEAPAQQPQAEPFGYVSQHTNGSWEFSPTAAGVYPDTAKSITAVYTKQPQAEVGNSGFDHKTASDFLSGKTVSDEAVRKFVQASRWAHDDRASLQSMLLSVRNELVSREAEIALLKKELMGAEESPQQAEAVPSEAAVVAGARVLNQRAAEACGVNADDQWAIYAEAFKDDVRAVLAAAQGEKP